MTQQQPSGEMNRLFTAAYEELRRLAGQVRRNNVSPTLNPTALVHEVYLKLSRSGELEMKSPLHFKRIAAQAMRQVLVDASRMRQSAKRGAGREQVTFDEGRAGMRVEIEDVVILDDALKQLAEASPRQALMFECRFFGGLTGSETAELLEVSEATVDRDWRAAKAWLSLQLKQGRR